MKKQLLGLVVVVVVGLLLLPLFWSRPARREGAKTVEVTEPRVELPVEAAPPSDSFGTEMGQLPSGSSLAPPPLRQQPVTPRVPDQWTRPTQQAPSWSSQPGPTPPRQQPARPQGSRPAPAMPAPHQATSPAPSAGSYSVQVAALVDSGKAHAMAVRLSELGFPAAVSPVRSGNKTLYRVRVGQVRNKAVAESLRQRLLESRGLQGRVVSNP